MIDLCGDKVVSSKEMARVEKLSIDQGASSQKYMLNAGLGISETIQELVANNKWEKKALLFVGKGNNGGDAYVVGIDLLKRGYNVLVLYLFDVDECSELNSKYFKEYRSLGGQARKFSSQEDFSQYEAFFVVDGLLGTGFFGETKGTIKEAINVINQFKNKIISIDIPSGLDGETGKACETVVKAGYTIYLGLPKQGFFLGDGYNVIGKLLKVDFGMEKKYIEQMDALGCLFNPSFAKKLLPEMAPNQHKYEKGYVVALAGSKTMPGAALLSALSAFRAGAGIVRLFYPEGMEQELSGSFSELIKTPWKKDDLKALFEEEKRARALLVGPGLGKSNEVKEVVKEVIGKATTSVIIDADAIEVFVKDIKDHPNDVVLTPHRAEFLKSIDHDMDVDDITLIQLAKEFARQHKVTLVLKGAPTWIFVKGKDPIIFPFGDPGMATAGSGDVLSGVIAAYLAHGLSGYDAALLGVYVHSLAGKSAAIEKSSYSLIASDIIEALPKVLIELKSS